MDEEAFTYDAFGNPTRYAGVTVVWNSAEQMLSCDDGETVVAFGALPDGKRAWKQEGAGSRTYYLYDGDTLVAELDEDGEITTLHLAGGGLACRGDVFYLYDP